MRGSPLDRALATACVAVLLLGGCDLREEATPDAPDAIDPKLADGGDDGGAEAGPDGSAGPSSLGDSTSAIARMEDSRRVSRPAFERLIEDPDVLVRRRAVLALGRIGRSEGLAPLRDALSDDDPEVRQAAFFGLGQLEASAHADATRVVRSFLDLNPSLADRRAAIAALGQVGAADEVGIMLEALESPEAELRAAAARAIGAYVMRQDPPAEPPFAGLVPRLTDADAGVRLAAAFALSRGAPPPEATAPAVRAALERTFRRDVEPEVRVMAGRALSRLGLGNPPVAVAALEQDGDYRVRTMAAMAIGATAPPPVKARALGIAWRRVRDDAAALAGPDLHPLVALLDAAADRPDPALSKALGFIYRDAAKRGGELEGRDRLTLDHLRCRAAFALDRIKGEPRAVKRCAPTAEGRMERWELRALEARVWRGSSSPTSSRVLNRLAGADDERVRLAAIETGSTIEGIARLPLIEKGLLDRSPNVVAAAAHGLFASAEMFEIEEEPEERLTVTEHTPEGPVTREIVNEAVKAPPLPAVALSKALRRFNPDEDLETAVNLLKVAGRLRVEGVAEEARTLAAHHNPAVRREARRTLARLGLDPGVEIAPDPPNMIDLEALAALGDERPVATVVTTRGTFLMTLRPDIAPGAVLNFLSLVRLGFYDGVSFHRVVPGFVVQTGDPTGTGFGGPGHTIRCETSEEPYVRGAVGMALAGPDTGGSQLFVAVAAQPHLDRRYTVFGSVTDGMDVVDALQQWDRILSVHIVGDPPAAPVPASDAGPRPDAG